MREASSRGVASCLPETGPGSPRQAVLPLKRTIPSASPSRSRAGPGSRSPFQPRR
jgi:hypothetical protein